MATTAPAKPRSRVRRWLLRGLITIGILIVLLIVAVQVVFWTNLPRDLVLGIVQRTLGLRVTAETLSTGFFGHTTLRDVTLSLPLADESFFKAAELRVDHTSIPGLLLKRTVALDSVALADPTLVVRQNAAGRWNLQEVAELLARAGGSGNAQQSGGASGPLPLPEVSITNGQVRIIANTGRELELAPLTVQGEPIDALTWQYDVAVADQLKAVGRVVPGGDFAHEVHVTLRNIDEWIALIAPDFEHDIKLDAEWRGRLAGGGVTGRLDIKNAAFDNFSASGPIAIRAGETIEAQPQGLTLSTGVEALPKVDLVGGAIRTEGDAVVVDRLRSQIGGGTASVSARYETVIGSLKGEALWQDITVAAATLRSGSASLSVTQPIAGRPLVDARLASVGSVGTATWDAIVNVDGATRGDGQSNWTIALERMQLTAGDRKANLKDTVAELTAADGKVTLTSLSRPDSSALTGGGAYDISSGNWYGWAHGLGPRLPGGSPDPLWFSFDAYGVGDFYNLKHFYLRDSDLELTAKGYYLATQPEPVFLNLSLTQVEENPALEVADGAPPLVGGRVMGDFFVHGKVSPVDLHMQGWLTGRNVVIAERALGDLKVELDGLVATDGALHVKTRELSLFGGRWSLEAVSPTPWNSTRVKVAVNELPMSELGQIAGREDVAGTVNGQWTLDIAGTTPADLTAVGVFNGVNLKAGPVVAQSLNGRTWLTNGTLRNELTLRQDNGEADIELITSLDAPTELRVKTDVDAWPMPTESDTSSAIASVQSDLQVDLTELSATGDAELSAMAFRNGVRIGDAAMKLNADGRIVTLQELNVNLLEGTATGTARIDLDRPREAIARFDWSDLNAGAIAELTPAAEGLAGTFSGMASLAPDPSPRALAPLSANITLTSDGGRFRTITIGNLDALLAIDPSDTWRVVADKVRLEIAGGTVDLWARAARHVTDDPILREAGRADIVMSQVSLRFEGLQLNPLVQAAKPDDKPLDASLAGEINFFADEIAMANLIGDARVNLSDGNLTNFGPIGQVMKQLNVVFSGGGGRNGTGTIVARIERGRVDLNKFTYFENGVEMRGIATVSDLSAGQESPVVGWLTGTLRPLRDTKVPFLASADDILSVLQGSLQAVSVTGTLGDLKVAPGALTEIGDSLKDILFGDVGAQPAAGQ
ncbi:MAG TPA: hypothetical protein VGN72_19570 [Tepidisphaeraceae bacterium]|jgi:hypothetical protein|nr:hypothetical protein [Tepidisphaeraceae bacterium]